MRGDTLLLDEDTANERMLIAGCGRGPCGCEEEARYARQAQRREVAAVPREAPWWQGVV